MFWGFYYDIIRIILLSQICVDLRCFFLPGLQSNISSDLKSSCRLASKNDFFPLILTHRNYHVFYYLLLGVSEEEQQEFQLKQPEDYFYLNQVNSPNPGIWATNAASVPLRLFTCFWEVRGRQLWPPPAPKPAPGRPRGGCIKGPIHSPHPGHRPICSSQNPSHTPPSLAQKYPECHQLCFPA